jgi:hypothetical protein
LGIGSSPFQNLFIEYYMVQNLLLGFNNIHIAMSFKILNDVIIYKLLVGLVLTFGLPKLAPISVPHLLLNIKKKKNIKVQKKIFYAKSMLHDSFSFNYIKKKKKIYLTLLYV